MTTILIILSVLLHTVLTGGAIMVWRTVSKTAQEQLPKVFFATMAARLLSTVLLFAAAAFLLRNDRTELITFAVIYIILYIIMLILDTAYFYCSSKQLK